MNTTSSQAPLAATALPGPARNADAASMADERDAEFMHLMAYVFLQNARPDKAAALLSALDILQPGQRRTLCTLAVAQVRAAKPQHALETLDRLAMAGGIDAAFHLLRAQALTLQSRRAEAAAAMKTYLQIRQASRGAANPAH